MEHYDGGFLKSDLVKSESGGSCRTPCERSRYRIGSVEKAECMVVTAWRLIDPNQPTGERHSDKDNALSSRSSVHDRIVLVQTNSLHLFDFGLRMGACLPFRPPNAPRKAYRKWFFGTQINVY